MSGGFGVQTADRSGAQTLYLSVNHRQRRAEDGRFRLISIAFAFMLCYAALGAKLLSVALAGRSLPEALVQAAGDISSAGQETVEGVRMMRGQLPSDADRLQPAVPALVIPRQDIRDRNGVILAGSVATRSLYVRPHEITRPEDVARTLMNIVPGLSHDRLMRQLTSSAKFVWIKRHLTPQEQEALLWAGVPGVYFHEDYQRIYPHGRLFSHVLGYTDVDGAGLAGVEKSFNRSLSRDDRDKPLALSLDARVQQALYSSLSEAMETFRAIAATGAVFHIPTGQALAMVSLPDYDPNRPMESDASARFNRLSVGQYELGSVFKALSTAMALEYGGVRMEDGFDATQPIVYRGGKITDYRGKNRWLSVPEILVYSSNIGTVKMTDSVGVDGQRRFLEDLGMTSAVGLEIGERSVPTVRADWKPIERATISYGHGISVTPMHLIRGMIAVTGGGVYRDLTLKAGVVKPGRQVVSPAVSAQVNRMLRAVVQHGTAKNANVPGYAVGAKTGTANKPVAGGYSSDKRISSLVAAFPMEKPEYFLFVMLDEPKGTKQTFNFATAGYVAAPLGGKLVRDLAQIFAIPPQYQQPEDAIDRMIMEAAARSRGNTAPQGGYVRRIAY